MRKIIECIIPIFEKEHHFVFEGDLVPSGDLNRLNVSLCNLQGYEICDSQKRAISIKCEDEDPITEDEIVAEILSLYSLENPILNIIFMDELLKEFMDEEKGERISVGTETFPEQIIFGPDLELYVMIYATDKYVYYTSADVFLMFSTETRDCLYTDTFAQFGLFESIENVEQGKEILYYDIDEGSNNTEFC